MFECRYYILDESFDALFVLTHTCLSSSMNTSDHLYPVVERRPWGEFMQFTLNEPTTVKILTVHAGQQLSLQYHDHRTEQWFVISGTGTATVGDMNDDMRAGKMYLVPKKTHHRISAQTDIQILEISFGDFREDDIVRLEDIYGRVGVTGV